MPAQRSTRTGTRRHGLMLGADWNIWNNGLFGLALGEQRTDQRLHTRQSRAKVDGTVVGLYAQGQWGSFTLSGSLSRGDYRIDSDRLVQVGSLSMQTIDARTEATATVAQVEAAWQVEVGALQLQPYLRLSRSQRVRRTRRQCRAVSGCQR